MLTRSRWFCRPHGAAETRLTLGPRPEGCGWDGQCRGLWILKTGTIYSKGDRVALRPHMQTRTELHLRARSSQRERSQHNNGSVRACFSHSFQVRKQTQHGPGEEARMRWCRDAPLVKRRSTDQWRPAPGGPERAANGVRSSNTAAPDLQELGTTPRV